MRLEPNVILTVVAYHADPEKAYELRQALTRSTLRIISSTIQVGPGGYVGQPILRQHLRFRCVSGPLKADVVMGQLMSEQPAAFWCRVTVAGPAAHRSEYSIGKPPKVKV